MSLDERVLSVVQALYDAALDETLWPAALEKLAEATQSQAAAFWVLHDAGTPYLPTFTYLNFDPVFIAEYLDHVVPLDPTVQYLVSHPDMAIVHDGLVISEREKDRHPYYDWHARFSDTRFRLVSRTQPDARVHAGVALHRTRRAGRYESGDIERFSVLHRHLESALSIGFRLGSLGTLQRCTAELLERNAAAVLLLDAQQRIVYANSRASAFHGDGIRLTGAVALERTRDNERLQALIRQVLAARAGGHDVPGGAMAARRPSGRQPFAIQVAPVSSRHAALSTVRPAVCIVVTDPEEPASPAAADRLRTMLDLTEAEARLAALLAAGQDLRAAGEHLGITYGTARVRLADIFRKTGTRRQSELVRLLVRIAA